MISPPSSVFLFSDIAQHLVRNHKLHSTHIHRCHISLVEPDDHIAIPIHIEGSLIGDRPEAQRLNLIVQPITDIFCIWFLMLSLMGVM